MDILALNCGSSSVKYQLFDWDKKVVVAKGMVERVVIGDSFILHEVPGRETYREDSDCPDHKTAVDLILRTLTSPGHGVLTDIKQIAAVGHRVVHGGERFTKSVLIDEDVLSAVTEVQHLAPLHNPPNIAGIEGAMAVLPGVPQIAIFDTAFHQTMPEHAYLYPLPYEWYEKYGVRRYGFHGTSHLYVSKRIAAILGKPADQCNVITMHIGNGVSHCAIKNGVSHYIASADAMKRNLEARVEIMCPVEPPELARELRTVFETYLADRRSAWDMQPDGTYIQRTPGDEPGEGSHHLLIARAEKRIKEHLKKKKIKKTEK